jgi:hypothetical protein
MLKQLMYLAMAMQLVWGPALAQTTFLSDEQAVPPYELPVLLAMQNGAPVKSRRVWEQKRRPELLQLFEREMFGKWIGPGPALRFEVVEKAANVLEGKAIRQQVAMYVGTGADEKKVDILMYLPSGTTRPVPVFVGLNFHGNHTVHADTAIILPTGWVANDPDFGAVDHSATVAGRGRRANRWPVEALLEKGYGLVTACYGDLFPDHINGFGQGASQWLERPGAEGEQTAAIGVWAWGLSKIADYLVQDPLVDARRMAVFGHSRLGKAALWAGAQDTRFSLVISNNSGCGGAALSRRVFGETVAAINNRFPHWFCQNFRAYNGLEQSLPFDQHSLLALMAPRPVYVASAAEDLWADPRGEFLAAYHAGEVYKLYGQPVLTDASMPALHQPVMQRTGYHIREGKHDVTLYDWQQYMQFADKWWKR